jgi:hypothetical protein
MRKVAYALICDCCGIQIHRDDFTIRPGEYLPILENKPVGIWDLCVTCRPDIENSMNKIRTKRIELLRRKDDGSAKTKPTKS